MGQAVNVRNDVALDTVISNIVIIDSVSGIIKADLGIKVCCLLELFEYYSNLGIVSDFKDGMIQGIGKAGNPHTMLGITPGMVVGVGTEIINGEGFLLTAGAIDSSMCLSSPKAVFDCLTFGITSIFGGGSGSGLSMSMNTPGPNHIK
jgi:urease alpha subunit